MHRGSCIAAICRISPLARGWVLVRAGLVSDLKAQILAGCARIAHLMPNGHWIQKPRCCPILIYLMMIVHLQGAIWTLLFIFFQHLP